MDRKYYNETTKEILIPENERKLYEDGLGCLIYERLKIHGDNTIQINTENGEEDKGSSLLQRSIRTALEMKARGIKENDVVSICSHNHPNAIVPLIAAVFIGAVPANFDPAFSKDDFIHLINLVKPKMIFISSEAFLKLNTIIDNLECTPEIIIFSNTIENNTFGSFLLKSEKEDAFSPMKRSLDELAVIFFSSGTTGKPKGICTTARTVLYHCNETNCESMLLFTSLYWISSYICSILCLLNGKTKVLCNIFDPATTWDICEKYKVEFLFLNPFKASAIIEYKPNIELLKLKVIIVAGSTVNSELLMKLKEMVPKTIVCNSYGQTETWRSFEMSTSLRLKKYESVGTPIPERTYKIVDLETEEALGFNQPGELRIKSKYITSGYYKHDDILDNGFDSNGFFKTGDIFYYDEDFCFYIVDRAKEMFKYRGWQVIPAKIENIIKQHPGVLDAVVVGIPHKTEENLSLAIIIPRTNCELEPGEIESYANNLLDDIHKIRAGVKIVQEFPQTPSGKVLRRKLKDMYLANVL